MFTQYNLISNTDIANIISSDIFSFSKGKGNVNVIPLNKALPMNVVRAFKREIGPYISHRKCYKNAVIAALYLKTLGYEVKVVEGYYRINHQRFIKDNPTYFHREGWGTHRWIVINGKHVDITLDCINDICKPKHFDYRSIRIYEAEDLLAFAYKTGKDCTSCVRPQWCSSLDGIAYNHFNTPEKCSYINEAGYYICLKNQKQTAV